MKRVIHAYFDTSGNLVPPHMQDDDVRMSQTFTRRKLFQLGTITAGGLLLSPLLNYGQAYAASIPSPQDCRITPPVFPNRTFPITRYGAVGDGTTDNTAAFQQAIAACSKAGGGHVIVPGGTFLTGAIHILSNVDLHLEKGSTILFSQDTQKYLPVVFTRNGGIELMNYSPFIYAFEQQNIGITGQGTIDGQADTNHWWSWKGKGGAAVAQLEQMANQGVPVEQRIFGDGYFIAPSFIQPYRCQNVLIQGVTLLRSPNWQLHPVLCHNVTIDGVTANSLGPNNDGCDPESCDGVLIQNCSFNTGDDCIAIKAGKNADGRRVNVPCQNIFISHCNFQAGHGGITIGSEMTGGVQHVYASNLQMTSSSLNICLRIKTNSVRGGFVRDIHLNNTQVTGVSGPAININFNYGEGDTGNYLPQVDNINVANLTVGQAQYAWDLEGYARDPIGTVSLTNCTFKNVQQTNIATNVQNLQLKNVVVNP